MSYGGNEENVFGGVCDQGQEVNWLMIFVVIALMYFVFIQYTKPKDKFLDEFVPEEKLEYFISKKFTNGFR
jgi:hypothetical protein